MNSYIFAGIMFVFLVVIIEMLLYAWRASSDLRKTKNVLSRLEENSWENGMVKGTKGVLKTKVFSSIPFLNRVLLKINIIQRLEKLVRQTNSSYAPAVYLLLAALLAVAGLLYGRIMMRNIGLGLLLAVVGCFLPFVWLGFKKTLRLKKFAVQLPDALDLIARSLKAGHSFSSGLRLVAENFPDPIGPEFNETIHEINYGLPLADALKNMGNRVGSPDLNFFIIATILQRETGGNLAEITETIAKLIRERFKFEDKVRVLAAEGKFSAFILIVLPFIMFFVIFKASPQYLDVLVQDPIGRKAGVGAIVMMMVGIITILRMIRIKV